MNQIPFKVHHRDISAITPALRYNGDTNIREWQDTARTRLSALLGMDRIQPASDDCFKIESETDKENCIDYRISFQSEDGYFVPCHLMVPKGVSGKIPMVICLQGHSTGMHISIGEPKYPGDEEDIKGGDRDFARQIVKEGYCALALEQRGFGECGGTEKGPFCILPATTALLYGRTILGERIFDISRAIDIVPKHFDFIDDSKFACMGNSGGGTATIYAAAMEERITVAMPSCALCTYKDSITAMRHCTCNYIPNIAFDFDMGDLCGLIAPRKLVVVSGKEDLGFPRNGVIECVDVAKTYFDALDVSDNLAWIEGPEGHRFYAALSWPTFHKMFD